jgi:acyl-[acyl-carrier-protein]-phospholipid O-acyltransferase / long-chain-fatty-acid--[acyl-carrier-protein] ligase
MKNQHGYGPLLADTRFEAFLWTQFLGAFNVSVFVVRVAAGSPIAGTVFVIPFLLFAGYAGQVADRFSKTRVLRITKCLEIVIMLMGAAALVAGRGGFLLLVLFLLATQANFFSLARYGILPRMMSEADLSRANGLLQLTTFMAIIGGAGFGTFLCERWQDHPLRLGAAFVAVAVAGTVASLHIRRLPASMVTPEPFHWNPFREIIAGAGALREQRTMVLAVLGISWFWFAGALFQMALLPAGKEALHASESQLGVLVTALAAGIGLGSIVAGAISGEHIELGLVPAGSVLMSFFSILLGLTSSYAWSPVWLAGVGFGGGLYAVPLNAYLQEHAGATEKGRIIATNNFANMLGVAGASGMLWLLHDRLHLNARAIIVVLGIATLAGSLMVARLMPATTLRIALWCVSKCLFRVRVEGSCHVPQSGGALLVANHLSYADPIFVGLTTHRNIRFLMWRPIYEIPFARPVFRMLLAIPIDLKSPRATISSLRAAREELLRGNLVAIFPEGQVTRTGDLNPFERGFGRVVEGTGAPIIPMNIEGIYGHPLSYKGGALLRSWERVWRPRITVRVGEPIHTSLSPAQLRRVVEELAQNRAASMQV